MNDTRWLLLKPDDALATPLYLQLAKKLAEAINSGWWRAHEALPSERVLAEHIGVSRVTARKAMDVLIEQRLVSRQHGSGTFITPHIEQPLSRLTSFTEQLRQRGFEPSSVWLERRIDVPDNEEAIQLGLSSHARVARLKRQRWVDGVVMAIEYSTVPVAFLPKPMDLEQSLYAFFDANACSVVRALQHVRAVNASPEIAALAGVRVGEAMLLMKRLGFTVDDVPIEITHTYCRSDYYDFVAELRK